MTEAHKVAIACGIFLALFIGMFFGATLEQAGMEKMGCKLTVMMVKP